MIVRHILFRGHFEPYYSFQWTLFLWSRRAHLLCCVAIIDAEAREAGYRVVVSDGRSVVRGDAVRCGCFGTRAWMVRF
jgi:hypothetical protein